LITTIPSDEIKLSFRAKSTFHRTRPQMIILLHPDF
jgi:hypothetical protein